VRNSPHPGGVPPVLWHPSRVQSLIDRLPVVYAALRPPATIWQPSRLKTITRDAFALRQVKGGQFQADAEALASCLLRKFEGISIANLDQLIYQAIFQRELSHIERSSIVDYMWHRDMVRLGVWTMFLPITAALWAMEPTDLVLVSLNPSQGLRDWLCLIVQQTLLGGKMIVTRLRCLRSMRT
jgi:hypothetical protein